MRFSIFIAPLLLMSQFTSAAMFGDGVNLQPAYTCRGKQNLGWEFMKEHKKIKSVRIEIEPPEWGQTRASMFDIRRWIDEANEQGMNVIATLHHWPNIGSNDKKALYSAAHWWVQNYNFLSQNSNFMINIHNEWGDHGLSREDFATAYNNAINTIRSQTDYQGPLIVDLPGYGQETHVAADASSEFHDKNIILSAHVYPGAYNFQRNDWMNSDDLEYLNNNEAGFSCMIGEFGSRMNGLADWSALVDKATSLGWPVLGWAWNGDGRQMNMISPYWGINCNPGSFSKKGYFSVIYRKLR